MTEKAQKADFRRNPPIFTDSPLLLEIQAFGGRRKPQKTADSRRKPQIGLRHLRCVTFSSALVMILPDSLCYRSVGGTGHKLPECPTGLFQAMFSLPQWSGWATSGEVWTTSDEPLDCSEIPQ